MIATEVEQSGRYSHFNIADRLSSGSPLSLEDSKDHHSGMLHAGESSPGRGSESASPPTSGAVADSPSGPSIATRASPRREEPPSPASSVVDSPQCSPCSQTSPYSPPMPSFSTGARFLPHPFFFPVSHLFQQVQLQQQLQRHNLGNPTLPFSIENILRPDFGGLLKVGAASRAFGAKRLSESPPAGGPSEEKRRRLSSEEMERDEKRRTEPKGVASGTRLPAGSPPQHSPMNLSKSAGGLEKSPAKTVAPPKKTSGESKKEDLDLKTDESCPPGMVRGPNGQLWPAWVFCTRYSDRPSSGPRSRKMKKKSEPGVAKDDKRPRTAFNSEQLGRLKTEFDSNRYLTEERRKSLADQLGLNENQIKIWFQNKRAKTKKSSDKGELAALLEKQGLYNHSTQSLEEEEYGM